MYDWLERAAARRPDHPAVVAGGRTLTYAELLARARALEPPSPFIEHPPGLDFAVHLHACLLRGLGAVPLDTRLTEGERERRRERAGDTSGLTAVVFTSGTTGDPRPVMLPPAAVQASALGTAALLGLHADDRWLVPLPLSHVGGLMVLLRSVIYATTAVIAQHDPEATLASMVPTQLARGLDAGMPRLRAILLGGGPVPPALREHPLVRETYGMTETCSMVTLDGFPLPGAAIEIAGDGEILVSGAMVCGGASELRTGDLGRIEGGRLRVTGRKTELIVTGGENVAPAEVEGVLTAHPDVSDAAVVGRPHPEWGEEVVALVVGAADPEALRAFCRERLAPFKVPKRFEVVPELPRTDSGKLVRADLR